MVYAVVILIKLSISTRTTELGKVLKQENIKVLYYLEKLLVHLKAVAALDDHDIHTLGSKFLQILTKVKAWFQQQGKPCRPVKECALGSEYRGTTEPKREDTSQNAEKFSFLADYNESPTTLNTTSWSTQFQSLDSYPDPNFSTQPSWNDAAFDFPMDLDPSLFTHLIEADQTQTYQDNIPPNIEAYDQMNYINNMPDFGSWSMQ